MAQDQPPVSRPPVPEHYEFPFQLLEQWISLPPDSYIEPRLTKRDIDRFLFGLSKVVQGSDYSNQALVEWSNGNAEKANESLYNSRRSLVEGNNDIRQFFAAIMISATRR